MTGTLRYISLLMGILLLTTVSCNDTDKVQVNENGPESEVEFILSSTPGTYAIIDPSGSISERTVKELDILVVKDDVYQYRRQANQDVNSFRTTLVVDNGLTLHFIANSRTLLANSNVLVEGNSWQNDIQPALILNDPEGLIQAQLLPMWGKKEEVDIEGGKINQLDDINLLRAVASVDIYNGENPETFTLQEAWLYFVPDQGYIAPQLSMYDETAHVVNAPLSPAAMQNYPGKLGVNTSENERIIYQLYLYENDAPTTSIQPKRYSRLVVGGSFEGGATTYYPVDFLDDDDPSVVLPATRNTKYVVVIGTVSSPGYPDPDTASEAFDTRMKVDVIDWNMEDENELVFDGPHYISLEEKWVYLFKPAGSTNTLRMTTNIDTDDIRMEFIDSGNGTVQTEGYALWNDRFRAELVFDDNNKIEKIRFTALGDYDETKGNESRNRQVLRLYSSRMEVNIDIIQLNESPTNWIDGGEFETSLGEEE